MIYCIQCCIQNSQSSIAIHPIKQTSVKLVEFDPLLNLSYPLIQLEMSNQHGGKDEMESGSIGYRMSVKQHHYYGKTC